jgi:hypothetical protein
MSFFSGESSGSQTYIPKWVRNANKWLESLYNQGTPDIPARTVVGQSDAEQQGTQLLEQYLNSSMPADYGVGMDQLRSTVAGEYDPSTSKYYQGYREASQMEEADAVNALRRRAQITGMGASSASLGKESKTRRGYSADRMGMLGQLYEGERNKMLTAAPQLMQGADYEGNRSLRQASAGLSLGASSRQIEQEQEDAIYNSVMQELMFPYEVLAPIASGVAGGGYTQKSWGESQSGLADVTQSAGLIATLLAGGGALI